MTISMFSDLQMEEETHRKELAELKTKLVDAEANLSEQTKRKEDLEKQEQQYWKEYSKHKREVTILMIDFVRLQLILITLIFFINK